MKPILNILHTESHRTWGGQELRVLNECLWMKKQGHRVLLAAPKSSLLLNQARSNRLQAVPFAFTNPSIIPDFFRMKELLKRFVPDVLNTHGNLDAKVALTAARGMGIPCVIRSRHHSHPVSPTWYNKLMYRHLSDYVFTTAQCVSEQLKEELSVAPEKVVTLPSGITPPDTLADRSSAIEELQQELQLSAENRFIGSVAMLGDWKGHRHLIDAFRRIAGRFPNHHLVIVGDGDEMVKLKQQCRDCNLTGKVHFTGFRGNPWPLFRAFDLDVLASIRNEGIPQVLLQAMYAGCPVIGTRVGGMPDIVEDGITGLLVEPEDSRSLADAMTAILDNPQAAAERVDRAQQYVRLNHTIEIMGRRTLDLYTSVMGTRRK